MKSILLLSSLLLAGCTVRPKVEEPVYSQLSIYQPSILSLRAGTKVQTTEGVYTAQTDEVWHSDKRYRELERKGY